MDDLIYGQPFPYFLPGLRTAKYKDRKVGIYQRVENQHSFRSKNLKSAYYKNYRLKTIFYRSFLRFCEGHAISGFHKFSIKTQTLFQYKIYK